MALPACFDGCNESTFDARANVYAEDMLRRGLTTCRDPNNVAAWWTALTPSKRTRVDDGTALAQLTAATLTKDSVAFADLTNAQHAAIDRGDPWPTADRGAPATGASGYVVITTSSEGAYIPAGAGLRNYVTGRRYAVNDDAAGHYVSGNIVRVTAIGRGRDTNCDAGDTMTWDDPPAGCVETAVVAAQGFTGGADARDGAPEQPAPPRVIHTLMLDRAHAWDSGPCSDPVGDLANASMEIMATRITMGRAEWSAFVFNPYVQRWLRWLRRTALPPPSAPTRSTTRAPVTTATGVRGASMRASITPMPTWDAQWAAAVNEASGFVTAPEHAHVVDPTVDAAPTCGCYRCATPVRRSTTFIVCPRCGNKRCPRGTDHGLACTGSNDTGQRGSRYA